MEVEPGDNIRHIGGPLSTAGVLVALCVLGAIWPVPNSQAQDSTKRRKAPTVLFLCPHGAAKSVLASAYFQRVAKERGLNVEVRSAGTDPDPQVSPAVASHLKANGYDVASKPRLATADDMVTADVVVSIGCDLKNLPSPRGTLITWDDVPSPSEEFGRADDKIRERVVALVEELVRKQQHR